VHPFTVLIVLFQKRCGGIIAIEKIRIIALIAQSDQTVLIQEARQRRRTVVVCRCESPSFKTPGSVFCIKNPA
jgi:hypothetical protein